MQIEWDTEHRHWDWVEDIGEYTREEKVCQLVSCTVISDDPSHAVSTTFYRKHSDQRILVECVRSFPHESGEGVMCSEDSKEWRWFDQELLWSAEMSEEEAEALVKWMDPADGENIH